LIAYNTGKNFINKKFKQYTIAIGTITKNILVETYNLISIIKRYYRLFRRTYQIICKELLDLLKKIILQIAFKTINDSIRLDGIIPILIVYGIYPRIIENNILSPLVS
jgi:hypothetical protein